MIDRKFVRGFISSFLLIVLGVVMMYTPTGHPQDSTVQATRTNVFKQPQVLPGVWQPGPAANTTATPAAGFAGTAASVSSSVTITFPVAFTQTPTCIAADQTATNAVKVAPTASNVVITNAGATDTDTIAFACFGNPN